MVESSRNITHNFELDSRVDMMLALEYPSDLKSYTGDITPGRSNPVGQVEA